mmetsp:Transcript_38389/g.44225  ORF Transcript_38389/g.44225 Transcript_38389/m.44225 type:complete len:394 (+) Transcript_38389:57-1238(+)
MLLALKVASIVLLFMVVLVFYLIILNPTAITTTSTTSFSSYTIKSTSSVAALSSSSSNRIPKNNNNNISIMTTMIAPTVVPNLLIVESPTDPATAAMNHKQGLRGSYQPIMTTTSTTVTTITRKKKILLSLWLIPPGGEEAEGTNDDDDKNRHNHKDKQQKKHNVYQSAQQLVNELSEQYNGPTFIPHVTIVGGIEVDSEEEARQLSKKLQEGLSTTSYVDSSTSGGGTRTRTTNTPTGIECRFKARLVSEPSCWNQALIVEMEPSNSFVQLCQRSRQLLGMEQPQQQNQPQEEGKEEQRCAACLAFPPPARVPHMSLYYGVPPNLPDPSTIDVSRIFGNSDSNGDGGPTTISSHRSFHFQAHRIMLVHTDPSTVDGVTEWRTIADIDLSASF